MNLRSQHEPDDQEERTVSRLEIILDHPDPALHPNGRAGWQKKHRLTKQHRAIAAYATLAEMRRAKIKVGWKAATIQATFVYTKRRTRDQDGAIGSLKAYCDGIADAGLLENDSALTWLSPIIVVDPNGQAYVKLVISEINANGQDDAGPS
jgi:hypothetical protein